ncbi:MAG TPA: hypothetical protein VHG29_05470 [Novosphingobium sp.]|nr:hypothetical protein [Novosphingobium sp.]
MIFAKSKIARGNLNTGGLVVKMVIMDWIATESFAIEKPLGALVFPIRRLIKELEFVLSRQLGEDGVQRRNAAIVP